MNLNKLNGAKINSSFEKGIEFIKTEKQVADSLRNRINQMSALIALAEGRKKELSDLIGSQPTETSNYWSYENDSFGLEDKVTYKIYQLDFDKSQEGIQSLTNLTIAGAKQNTTSTEQNKRSYNDLSYKVLRIQDRIKSMEKLMNNLDIKSNRKIKLGEHELDRYGF